MRSGGTGPPLDEQESPGRAGKGACLPPGVLLRAGPSAGGAGSRGGMTTTGPRLTASRPASKPAHRHNGSSALPQHSMAAPVRYCRPPPGPWPEPEVLGRLRPGPVFPRYCGCHRARGLIAEKSNLSAAAASAAAKHVIRPRGIKTPTGPGYRAYSTSNHLS